MARSAAERERLKQWARNWSPQPREGRLSRYRKLRFKTWTEYNQNRVVLKLTPAERQKAESIYDYLCVKHEWKVRTRKGYPRILWACAVSRARKTGAQRYEHLSVVKKLDYWFNVAVREGFRPVTAPVKKTHPRSTQSSSAGSPQMDDLLTALEQMTRVRPQA